MKQSVVLRVPKRRVHLRRLSTECSLCPSRPPTRRRWTGPPLSAGTSLAPTQRNTLPYHGWHHLASASTSSSDSTTSTSTSTTLHLRLWLQVRHSRLLQGARGRARRAVRVYVNTCSLGLRVPACWVLYVPEAQGSLPRACRAYRVPWHPRFASVAALHKQCSDVLALRQNVLDATGRHGGGEDPMGECAAVTSLLRYYRLLCSLETRMLPRASTPDEQAVPGRPALLTRVRLAPDRLRGTAVADRLPMA